MNTLVISREFIFFFCLYESIPSIWLNSENFRTVRVGLTVYYYICGITPKPFQRFRRNIYSKWNYWEICWEISVSKIFLESYLKNYCKTFAKNFSWNIYISKDLLNDFKVLGNPFLGITAYTSYVNQFLFQETFENNYIYKLIFSQWPSKRLIKKYSSIVVIPSLKVPFRLSSIFLLKYCRRTVRRVRSISIFSDWKAFGMKYVSEIRTCATLPHFNGISI